MLMLGGKPAPQHAATPSKQHGRQPAHPIPSIGLRVVRRGEPEEHAGCWALVSGSRRAPPCRAGGDDKWFAPLHCCSARELLPAAGVLQDVAWSCPRAARVVVLGLRAALGS